MPIESRQFDSVLAEMLSDFEASANESAEVDDAVQRLSLAALHTLAAQTGGQLPRPGMHAYVEGAAPSHPAVPLQLDVLF